MSELTPKTLNVAHTV